MPYVQRNDAGEITGKFANSQYGYAEEWVEEESPELTLVSPAQSAAFERFLRDQQLKVLVWLRDRHRDQLEIGVDPTLSHDQFKALLVYMQVLRDWPQSPEFPNSEHRPVAPAWVADQID
ncbi:phage tail assembly chaperone [Pseudomonas sp. CHM02]|uniref:phage tail assembly chaperone n=1 Tax=Pseudomonas sp. CHM02 TaxID=1463662 RepID=UPI00046EA5AF|nr:phage tail assembly chaperone [Pseudomonas sp. CHM02]